jgi:hypothetical protein
MLAFFALTMASAPTVSAPAAALMALVASAPPIARPIAIARLHHYRWSDIVE